MRKALAFTVIGIGVVISFAVIGANADPDSSAKVKCEFGIENATALRVGTRDVVRATVSGDEFNGTVRMPFTAGSTAYIGECVFEHGRFRRITINGQIVAGR